MKRRDFIKRAGVLGAGGALLPDILKAAGRQDPVLLVVSGWQDVNIGDIAHTPGLLHVLETFIPEARIILWKRRESKTVENLLEKNFPNVRIIHGNVDAERNVDSSEVMEAFREADLMIHGSGPHIVGRPHLQSWVRHTGKPFGIFGTTIQRVNSELGALLRQAAFIYTRETLSLGVLREAGIRQGRISFAPDATFFLHLHDRETAGTFMKASGLKEKQFICVIPRLRVTPYYDIFPDHNYSDERIREIEALNAKHKETDHAKLREAMIAWVRRTGNKVLVCPEMTYQLDIMDELLIDPLPEDVKPNIIKRGYWLPDEAASVYEKAHSVLSFECHTPIIALANGTPAFYLRQPEDTIKGHMYHDLGFSDWIFEIEETESRQIVDRFMKIVDDYETAEKLVANNMSRIGDIYSDSCRTIQQLVT